MVASHDGPLSMNQENAYELRWAELAEISEESMKDLSEEPIRRKYAPWVHAMLAEPAAKDGKALLGRVGA